MEYELANAVIGVASNIVDNDVEHMRYDIEECYTMQDVRNVFERSNIRWVDIVEEEITRVMNGLDPIYFVPPYAYVDSYRRRNHIHLINHSGSGMRHVSEIAQDFDLHFVALESQKKALGVTLSDYAYGFACHAEAETFYASEEWKRMAKVIRYFYDYRCTSCRRNRVLLHVHHETPIISAYASHFHVNFAEGKLRPLCEDCHRDFHSKTVRGYGNFFVFTDEAEIKQEKKDLRLLRKAHDELKICPHCFGYRPGWQQLYRLWGVQGANVAPIPSDVNFYAPTGPVTLASFDT